jgi:hypothetical protein
MSSDTRDYMCDEMTSVAPRPVTSTQWRYRHIGARLRSDVAIERNTSASQNR